MKRFVLSVLRAVSMGALAFIFALQFSPLIFIRVFVTSLAVLLALSLLSRIRLGRKNRLNLLKVALCLGFLLTESAALFHNSEVRADGSEDTEVTDICSVHIAALASSHVSREDLEACHSLIGIRMGYVSEDQFHINWAETLLDGYDRTGLVT